MTAHDSVVSADKQKPNSATLGRQVRFYAAVTAIAIMVWVVAEGQTLQRQTIEMRLEIRGDQQHEAQVETEGWTGTLKVTLEGSATSATGVQGLSGEILELVPGQAGLAIEDGVHTVDLRPSIRELLASRRSALSVVRVEPPTVAVRVWGLDRVEQEIEVVLPDGIEATDIKVSPSRVTLMAPRGSLPEGLVARVELDAANLAGLPQGRAVTLSDQRVEVTGREGSAVPEELEIDPGLVSVEMKLQTRAAKLVLPTVPIVVQLPPTELNRWNVEIPDSDRVLRDVTLTGPASVIEAYRRGDRELLAVVRLGFEELENRIESKRAEFPGLGAGIGVEVEDPEVELGITPRSAAVPAGG